MDPTEITHENFLVTVSKHVPKNKRAQAAMIKNQAIQIIKEMMPNNPAYYEKLYERLKRLICDEKARRQKNAGYFTNPEVYAEIYNEALAEEKERKKVFGAYHATQFEFSLYGRLNETLDRNTSLDLTKKIFKQIKSFTEMVDYKQNSCIEQDIRKIVYVTLSSYVPLAQINDIMDETMTLVRVVL